MSNSLTMKFVLILAWLTAFEATQINPFSMDIVNDVQTELKLDSSFIRELVQRVEFLEARDRSHTHEINGLKEEIAKQKNEVTVLQKKNDKQDRLISRLMQRLLIRGGISMAPPSEDVAVADRMTIESKGNRIRRSDNEVTVAFTAGLTHRVQHMVAHQDIVFDRVMTNIGSGYNSSHGTFTAPVAGIYLFYTSVLADYNRELWCQIVVNGHNKAMTYARGSDGRHDQGSQIIIVQLQKGDSVAVQNSAANDAIYGDGYIYSTFSGFRLQDYSQYESIVG